MTVTIKIGRRMPRVFARRLLERGKNWLSLQQQIWLYINLAFSGAKKAADNRPEEQVVITIENKTEFEDLQWQLEFKIITVSSIIHAKEVEEYEEVMGIYKKFNLLKQLQGKKIEGNEGVRDAFNSKVITKEQFEKSKIAGLEAIGKENVADKLLDLGIVTIIEKTW